jgi:hypothetical protein
MELLIGIILVGLIAWWAWTVFAAPAKIEEAKAEETKPEAAPYKVETPSWHTAPPEGTKPVVVENPLDVNHDGKVNFEDVKEVVKKTRTRAKKVADVNGDGKVTTADAKAAVKKVTKGRKPRSAKA